MDNKGGLKFSVCIPAYNSESFLEECVESVLNQTYKNFEIIIVNDGSKDKTGIIAEAIKQKDPRVRVIHQENKGLFHTRISAISASKGKYIVSLDADDQLEPYTLSLLSQFDDDRVDIILFNHKKKRSGKSKEYISLGNEYNEWNEDNKEELIKYYLNGGNVRSLCMKAIRRSLFDFTELNNYPRISFSEDWIHSFYPMTRASVISYLPDALYIQRIDETSMTHHFDPSIYDSFRIVYQLRSTIHIKGVITPEQWLLKALSKSMIYHHSKVDNKLEYFCYLKRLHDDEWLNSIIKANKKTIKLAYRIPIDLLCKGRYSLLYIMKRGISNIRSLYN